MSDEDRDIEDGMGFSGLVPTKEERALEEAMKRDTKQADEMRQLAAFGAKVLEELKEAIVEGGCELDAWQIADMAVECELMQHVPFDPKKHGGKLECERFEEGDMIYYWGDK